MALSEHQLARLRRKVGDTGATPAFTDDELQDLYTEAGEDWDTTVLYAYDELLAQAAKFNDYSAGESDEKRSQVFANLTKLRDRWAARVASGAKAANQVRIVGTRTAPRRKKDVPNA
jgi:hypothetical protein